MPSQVFCTHCNQFITRHAEKEHRNRLLHPTPYASANINRHHQIQNAAMASLFADSHGQDLVPPSPNSETLLDNNGGSSSNETSSFNHPELDPPPRIADESDDPQIDALLDMYHRPPSPPFVLSDSEDEEDARANRADQDADEDSEDEDLDNVDWDGLLDDIVRLRCTDDVELRVGESAAAERLASDTTLSALDRKICRVFAYKLVSHTTDANFKRLKHTFPDDPPLPSLKKVRARVTLLAGIQPEVYHCCVNSCMCYTGDHAELDRCKHCKEPRYDSRKRPRKVFIYIPVTPRLQSFLENRDMAKKMQYRGSFQRDEEYIRDVFDCEIYRKLRLRNVRSEGKELPHKYFEDPRDVALGLSTNGFAPFKRRKHTAWPLIVFNYNLGPEERFHSNHILALGCIPGPSKPKDADSFLWPFRQELHRLAVGEKSFDILSAKFFLLRAFLILTFGDIPAMSMLMHMKGHNGYSPCRMCKIVGVRIPDRPQVKVLYVPHQRSSFPPQSIPDGTPVSYDLTKLPMRTHNEFIDQALEVERAPTKTAGEALAKKYGIKALSAFAALDSISFPTSFPYDFMHLIWENLIKNLVSLWISDFKGLDTRTGNYELPKGVWEKIGAATAASSSTIPSAFGAKIPDVCADRSLLSAEMWSFWAMYLAPIFLRDQFENDKYYDHFLDLMESLGLCLDFEIKRSDVRRLRKDLIAWVTKYESFYYQNNPQRAGACPVTLHAILHIPDNIEDAGPSWAYWSFPMEHFCGELQPGIRSRRFPFRSIDRYILEKAQLTQIKLKYGIQEELDLCASRANPPGAYSHPAYPTCILLYPKQSNWSPLPGLLKSIAAALVTRFSTQRFKPRFATVMKYVKHAKFTQWGRVRRIDSDAGDTMNASELGNRGHDYRDASFVQYAMYVDGNVRRPALDPNLTGETFYGQMQCLLVIELPRTDAMWNDLQPKATSCEDPSLTSTLIMAVIRECKVEKTGAKIAKLRRMGISFYSKTGQLDIIDITCVQNLAGRAQVLGSTSTWAVIDRSRTLAQAIFREDNESEGSDSD